MAYAGPIPMSDADPISTFREEKSNAPRNFKENYSKHRFKTISGGIAREAQSIKRQESIQKRREMGIEERNLALYIQERNEQFSSFVAKVKQDVCSVLKIDLPTTAQRVRNQFNKIVAKIDSFKEFATNQIGESFEDLKNKFAKNVGPLIKQDVDMVQR